MALKKHPAIWWVILTVMIICRMFFCVFINVYDILIFPTKSIHDIIFPTILINHTPYWVTFTSTVSDWCSTCISMLYFYIVCDTLLSWSRYDDTWLTLLLIVLNDDWFYGFYDTLTRFKHFMIDSARLSNNSALHVICDKMSVIVCLFYM